MNKDEMLITKEIREYGNFREKEERARILKIINSIDLSKSLEQPSLMAFRDTIKDRIKKSSEVEK